MDIDRLLDDDPDYVDEVIDHLLGGVYSHEMVKSVLKKLGASTLAAQTAHQAYTANKKSWSLG
jgi:hypothetical protein